MNKINNLKDELKIYKVPKVLYYSFEEWENKQEEALKIIKNGIYKWIAEDDFEFEHMQEYGITIRQNFYLIFYIQDALEFLTNNKKWSIYKSREIFNGINCFITGMVQLNAWKIFYNNLEQKQMANMIYKIIEIQLVDKQLHGGSILENIPIYKCIRCGKNDYVADNYICYNCYNCK